MTATTSKVPASCTQRTSPPRWRISPLLPNIGVEGARGRAQRFVGLATTSIHGRGTRQHRRGRRYASALRRRRHAVAGANGAVDTITSWLTAHLVGPSGEENRAVNGRRRRLRSPTNRRRFVTLGESPARCCRLRRGNERTVSLHDVDGDVVPRGASENLDSVVARTCASGRDVCAGRQ